MLHPQSVQLDVDIPDFKYFFEGFEFTKFKIPEVDSKILEDEKALFNIQKELGSLSFEKLLYRGSEDGFGAA